MRKGFWLFAYIKAFDLARFRKFLFPWNIFLLSKKNVFIRKLTYCKSTAVINHKFQGYADTSPYPETVPQRCSVNMQWIYRRTFMHLCGFHKFELQVWVFSCKLDAYLQDTIFAILSENLCGTVSEYSFHCFHS